MTREEYDRIDAVNWTTLKAMRASPKHYRYAAEHATEDTAAMRDGRAVHTAVLEPDRFPLDYAIWAGERRAGKSGRFSRPRTTTRQFCAPTSMPTASRSGTRCGPIPSPGICSRQAKRKRPSPGP